MENTIITSKYLHKKFKKSTPTIIVTTEQQQNTPTSTEQTQTNNNNKLTNNNSVTIPQQLKSNNNEYNNSEINKEVPVTIYKNEHNENSVIINSSTNNSVILNKNDQVASISTNNSSFVDSVPFTPSSQPIKFPLLSSSTTSSSSIYNSEKLDQLNSHHQQDISNPIEKNGITLKWELSSSTNPSNHTNSPTSPSTVTISIPADRLPYIQASNTTPINETDNKKSEPNQGGKYVCSYCNLSCSKPSVLEKHIRAHTNERPYPCDICGISFKTRSNLYKHFRSRSHANRIKDTSDTMPPQPTSLPPTSITISTSTSSSSNNQQQDDNNKLIPKSKPYKPKFRHSTYLYEQQNSTAAAENDNNENKEKDLENKKKLDIKNDLKQNTDLLKQHINNIIHKNQTILDVNEPNILKKRFLYQIENNEHEKKNSYENNDEPLNLTASRSNTAQNQNRKRCMSETAEHSPTSLIKELLLKNLTQDKSYVCQFCKISFKNIENFEIHRKKYCKVGENPTSKDIALVRSHSVNVASVLTQKYSRNNESPSKFVRTTLPLKSPGPYLGKTSLIGDKPNQVFYENRNPTKIHHAAIATSAPLSISTDNLRKIDLYTNQPLKIDIKKPEKRNYEEFQMSYSPTSRKPQQTPIKLFGGEVKITETSGETRSFKIDSNKPNEFVSSQSTQHVNSTTYSGCKVSENMVIKSTLQSGGTMLQNNSSNYDIKSSPFTPKLDEKSPIFQFQYNDSNKFSENSSPRKIIYSGDNVKKEQSRFTFDEPSSSTTEMIYDQRLIDFNQKNAKMFAPTIKQPNLTIPGLPVPNKMFTSPKKSYNDDQMSPSWPFNNFSEPIKQYSPTVKYRQEMPTPSPVELLSPKVDLKKIEPKFRHELYSPNPIKLPPETDKRNSPGLRLYDPLNILINGKLVRYVPGMPGPDTGNPIQVGFMEPPPIIATQLSPKIIRTSPVAPRNYEPNIDTPKSLPFSPQALSPSLKLPLRSSPNVIQYNETLSPRQSPVIVEKKLETKPSLKNFRIFSENSIKTLKSVENIEKSENSESIPPPPPPPVTNVIPSISTTPVSTPTTSESLDVKSESNESKPNKFLRPNSLALKPYIKTHHGLTPTIFNQALISPDTPRVAKKYCQLYLNGNCFSYLGLKSSTKSTYCTLNKTQPFYVQSFGTLSMYSEWRHLECKLDYVRLDTYNSSQIRKNYTIAQTKRPDLTIVDSSYKSVMVETSQKKIESTNRGNTLPGGYESNEEYTYIRGRGRGKYVCDQCGIRCKKPSMLKKHIRTHSDVRPYTCRQCNFSFKTKGNLTKHMKSKAHYKRTSSVSTSDANGETQASQCSSTPSDEDSDSDADNENDSDDSTRLQDHEAAHCLLSLAQNRSPASSETENNKEMTTENNLTISSSSSTITSTTTVTAKITNSLNNSDDKTDKNSPNVFENMSSRKPLTYPYVKIQATKSVPSTLETKTEILKADMCSNFNNVILGAKNIELFSQNLDIRQETPFSPAKVLTPTKIQYIADKLPNADVTIANYQQKFVKYEQERAAAALSKITNNQTVDYLSSKRFVERIEDNTKRKSIVGATPPPPVAPPVVIDIDKRNKIHSIDLTNNFNRKRKISYTESSESRPVYSNFEVATPVVSNKAYNSQPPRGMDLTVNRDYVENRNASARIPTESTALDLTTKVDLVPKNEIKTINKLENDIKMSLKRKVLNYKFDKEENPTNILKEPNEKIIKLHENLSENTNSNESEKNVNIIPSTENDTSAMQTLADIAIKRNVSTEKTKLAQSVATEYLKLATKSEIPTGVIVEQSSPACNGTTDNAISDLIVNSEENKSCTICAKNFSKPSQLRLHMNIHYIERPFRCESCSVSFRSKGHLQKHERSASHHNKVNLIKTSSSEPRPFKCSDCNIAFRIHGHLAKHLRSKMHIMRLECLARVPFGLYAELERANSLLTEINTTDCDMCLESLKILARKLFSNDPSKLVKFEHQSSMPPSSNQEQQIAIGSP
ncbi:uncharacterized protein LOC123299640 isoform X2 [Chrysoperla carnea]|uniref:uncharacterized protein LOC123299640 isoform X2 n=1 Tax=Chrysoperla carnea TaxID=189513 RepID=UPI001D076AB8|nr:uncharacterized protein LOC123299640 isoform X2 [Chrysoperla carnea]